MAKYLVSINLGPVQGFIATARRTRDLWYGSYILSEVSKSVARYLLLESNAELIFPAVTKEQQNRLAAPVSGENPTERFNVANRIVAIISAENLEQLKKWLKAAKNTAQDCWYQQTSSARVAYTKEAGALPSVRDFYWNKQRDDVLEIQYAWTLWKEEKEGFKKAFDRLKQTEAARKNTRNFLPSDIAPEPGFLPKSSLDAARETVLAENLKHHQRLRLGLGAGEHLDCPGLTKRLCGGQVEYFTPVARIALHNWLKKLEQNKLYKLCDISEELRPSGWISSIRADVNHDTYKNYPYDAQLLLPSRLDAAISEQKKFEEEKSYLKLLEEFKSIVLPLWKQYGEPNPYVVMLLADGDRMGELLDQAAQAANPVKSLQDVSQALANFVGSADSENTGAKSIHRIVAGHGGHCIYAGGDDVLALLPLGDQALKCAQELAEHFKDSLAKIAEELKVEKAPTLSVGLAVQHTIEPLGQFRKLAEQAEKLAKGDKYPKPQQRNALGIVVQPRSGVALEWRQQWHGNVDGTQPIALLSKMISWFDKGKIPTTVAYELEELKRSLKWLEKEHKQYKSLSAAEVGRILERKRTSGGAELGQEIIKEIQHLTATLGLEKLSQSLLVARWFAAHGLGGK